MSKLLDFYNDLKNATALFEQITKRALTVGHVFQNVYIERLRKTGANGFPYAAEIRAFQTWQDMTDKERGAAIDLLPFVDELCNCVDAKHAAAITLILKHHPMAKGASKDMIELAKVFEAKYKISKAALTPKVRTSGSSGASTGKALKVS